MSELLTIKPLQVYSDAGRCAAGFHKEKRDCTVRAASLALQIPYVQAHDLLKSLGRRDGCGFNWHQFAMAADMEVVPEFCQSRLSRVLTGLTYGRYVVRVRGHVFAVIDGTVYDTGTNSPRKIVQAVYKPA